jgi:hypothetical protein
VCFASLMASPITFLAETSSFFRLEEGAIDDQLPSGVPRVTAGCERDLRTIRSNRRLNQDRLAACLRGGMARKYQTTHQNGDQKASHVFDATYHTAAGSGEF